MCICVREYTDVSLGKREVQKSMHVRCPVVGGTGSYEPPIMDARNQTLVL